MYRFIVTASIFLLIGNVQTHIIRRDISQVEEEAEKVLKFVEDRAREFKKVAQTIQHEIVEVFETFNKTVKPVIDKFEEEMSKSNVAFENKIEGLLKVNLSEQSCGMLNIHDNTMEAYNVVKMCSEKVSNDVVNGIRQVTGDVEKISDEFLDIRKTIEKCKLSSDMNKEDKKECYANASKLASNIVKSFASATTAVSSTFKALHISVSFNQCLAVDGTLVVAKKLDFFANCLGEKFGISEEIEKVTDIFKKDIIASTKKIGQSIENELKNLQNKVDKISIEVVEGVSKLFDSTTEELKKVVKILDNITIKVGTFFKGAWGKVNNLG